MSQNSFLTFTTPAITEMFSRIFLFYPQKKEVNLSWKRLPNKHRQNESPLGGKSSLHTYSVTLVPQGTIIWASPVQPSSIKFLATLPRLHLAFTVDTEETVKVWNCQYEDALAMLTMPRVSFSVEALLTKDDPFLMVSEPCSCWGPIPATSQPSL